MAPSGIAIIMGAGPTTSAGIGRILASPAHGNLAVALLSRSGPDDLAARLARESQGTLKAFRTDTSEASQAETMQQIRAWAESLGSDLKLKLAVWCIKHSHRTPFAEETAARFGDSIQTYVTGAMVFAQHVTGWMLSQYASDTAKLESGEEAMVKKGTLIFTGTLGAMRTNTGYAAYGAGRAGVRMLAQSLAREYSEKGLHVVHAIANGGIADVEGEVVDKEKREKVNKGQSMAAESVGKLYLSVMNQECDLWVHELDMRPAKEKF